MALVFKTSKVRHRSSDLGIKDNTKDNPAITSLFRPRETQKKRVPIMCFPGTPYLLFKCHFFKDLQHRVYPLKRQWKSTVNTPSELFKHPAGNQKCICMNVFFTSWYVIEAYLKPLLIYWQRQSVENAILHQASNMLSI